jgi:hypothetical protein
MVREWKWEKTFNCDWARLIEMTAKKGVPFFFKQIDKTNYSR